ncbi:MAG: nucleotidyltransferase family protein [Candidatus Omnitrophica bacterium]|nr:nucleotidyltransferase family protein [Candidatus Omnitrophota bacterium]
MDFKIVLEKITDAFEKNKISYALIGGFALGIYGVVRSTNDLDFLIDKNHQAFLKNAMQQNAYNVIHESNDVVQFEHPAGAFGSIDFLYAFRQPSLEMLNRAVKKRIFEESMTLRVLLPEDIIGLKVQSFQNNLKRKILDLEDIKGLLEANAANLNWGIIEKHFNLFGLNDMYMELKKTYAKK